MKCIVAKPIKISDVFTIIESIKAGDYSDSAINKCVENKTNIVMANFLHTLGGDYYVANVLEASDNVDEVDTFVWLDINGEHLVDPEVTFFGYISDSAEVIGVDKNNSVVNINEFAPLVNLAFDRCLYVYRNAGVGMQVDDLGVSTTDFGYDLILDRKSDETVDHDKLIALARDIDNKYAVTVAYKYYVSALVGTDVNTFIVYAKDPIDTTDGLSLLKRAISSAYGIDAVIMSYSPMKLVNPIYVRYTFAGKLLIMPWKSSNIVDNAFNEATADSTKANIAEYSITYNEKDTSVPHSVKLVAQMDITKLDLVKDQDTLLEIVRSIHENEGKSFSKEKYEVVDVQFITDNQEDFIKDMTPVEED